MLHILCIKSDDLSTDYRKIPEPHFSTRVTALLLSRNLINFVDGRANIDRVGQLDRFHGVLDYMVSSFKRE